MSQYPNDQVVTDQPPTILRRLTCLSYEMVIVVAVLFLSGIPVAIFVGDATSGVRHSSLQLYVIVVLAFYFVWFWTRGGQTLAMRTWRVRLLSVDGSPLSPPRACLRFAVACCFLLPALIALVMFSKYRAKVPWAAFTFVPMVATILWARFDRDKQFLHDRLAGTKQMMTLIVKPEPEK
jgi:uncharacterized RDD family membrane protein YckC